MGFLPGARNPKWKGGKTTNEEGYIRITAGPHRGRYEHRVLWEIAFGPIPTGMDVHHRDEDRSHNVLPNFELREATPHRLAALKSWEKRSKQKKRKDLTHS
jgi:hypothetical protein